MSETDFDRRVDELYDEVYGPDHEAYVSEIDGSSRTQEYMVIGLTIAIMAVLCLVSLIAGFTSVLLLTNLLNSFVVAAVVSAIIPLCVLAAVVFLGLRDLRRSRSADISTVGEPETEDLTPVENPTPEENL